MGNKVVLDTNVPAKAATAPNLCPSDELRVQAKCMEYIYELVNGNDRLVLDAGYEIIREYRNNVDKTSNIGVLFLKWLDQYLGKIDMCDLLRLEKNSEDEYIYFPKDEDTRDFDPNDRKFVALANMHSEKPPIVEGTDGKWWGYVSAFRRYGIEIKFLDPEYAKSVYERKILSKKPRERTV